MRLLDRLTFVILTGSVASGAALSGCDDPAAKPPSHYCTLIGCSDGFSLEIAAMANALPPGVHTISVTTGSGTSSCTIPFPWVAPGDNNTASCESGLRVSVSPKQQCTTVNDSYVRCDEIPGQLVERITVPGTPASVHVTQSAGDAAVFDQTFTPTYQDHQPNGPDCAPICRQAAAQLTLP